LAEAGATCVGVFASVVAKRAAVRSRGSWSGEEEEEEDCDWVMHLVAGVTPWGSGVVDVEATGRAVAGGAFSFAFFCFLVSLEPVLLPPLLRDPLVIFLFFFEAEREEEEEGSLRLPVFDGSGGGLGMML
jgi:hypothetical protein